jgi:GMP synthase (glutamine-hydrolysing)
MSANDPDDYIRQEIEWIGVPLKERKPFLGICLGAQMLARHLGAPVAPHPEAVEIGYFPLQPAHPSARDWPQRIYHWHAEGFELPSGSRLLATSDGHFPNQAFAYDHALGLQFHPEITLAMVHRWTTRGARRLSAKGAQPREHQLTDHIVHAPVVQAWLRRTLRSWVAEEKF